ncbi:diguanylate cyclase [Crenobacter luteus]|uniref:diguanylate cyclase n=1 Tax=Crenobacter luteus TaxID=1452487 RepID=A0A161SGN5_9NEIS|nr:GGDEF domain-containing protein [Crenobacter luteus]KZE32740.1 diguanylate cyclase [Crenobacter luteus]TCP12631.1 diguanylate cyclase [Crenobacter luteus]
MTTNNPIDIARETLKQLTSRKLLPTPENFERLYHEIARTPVERENKLARQLLHALETLPNPQAGARPLQARLKQAMEDARWEQVPQLVIDYVRQSLQGKALARPWGTLIHELVRQWDMRQSDLPQHYKQAALERVLTNFGNQPDELNRTLNNLVLNWAAPPAQRGSIDVAPADDAPADLPATVESHGWRQWKKTLAFVIKQGIEPQLTAHPKLIEQLAELADELAGVADESALDRFVPRLRAFMIKMELNAVQEERLVHGLSSLLKLMLDNIAELNRSDSFLVGQIDTLQAVLAQEPLSMQQIYLLETSLKEVIRKQGTLKTSLDEATSSLRALLDRFLARLAQMSDNTDDFQTRIGRHSEKLKHTRNVDELGGIIGALLEDTAAMQLNLGQSRDELVSAREQVSAAEARIRELEVALETTSAKVREDQLTGAYNRRGLIEHFEREISRAERTGQPLCLALIDVDNFKQLNDRYGHLAGDDALKYLVDVIRHNARPTDIVARYGGEEFVILLPDTPVDDALQMLQRLQRELTRTFFLANNDRLVITFSAGVAKWHLGENDSDVIERADQAMYQAKLAGKNRVCSAEDISNPLAAAH